MDTCRKSDIFLGGRERARGVQPPSHCKILLAVPKGVATKIPLHPTSGSTPVALPIENRAELLLLLKGKGMILPSEMPAVATTSIFQPPHAFFCQL